MAHPHNRPDDLCVLTVGTFEEAGHAAGHGAASRCSGAHRRLGAGGLRGVRRRTAPVPNPVRDHADRLQELAEDVVQDALVKAHAKWKRISALDRPDLYVKRIVTNEFLSWRRRRRVPTVQLEPDLATPFRGSRPPSHEETSADRDARWAELERLPRQQRAVLVLRFYEGLDDTEIATVLDCRPGTVRGYGSRALATLRIELADWRQTPEEDR